MLPRDLNAGVFEAEVEHRLEHIGTYLRDFVCGRPSSVVVPLWNLRALQDESKQAGHKDMAALCEWMEVKIMALQTGQSGNSDDLAHEIARAGERLRQRAREFASLPPVEEPAEQEHEIRIA